MSFRETIIQRMDDAGIMFTKVEAISGKQVKVTANSSRGTIANAVGGHAVKDNGDGTFTITKSS